MVTSATLAFDREGRGLPAAELRLVTVVCAAHFMSHFLQLVLPPLFPLLRTELGVSYAGLGVLMTLFYATSAIGQTVSGFLVDRFGARRILLGGLGLFATALALAGFSVSYWTLMPAMLLAGAGNSVFHPADYSIFNAAVHPRRLGRAYSAHSMSGSVGWALSPLVTGGLTLAFGWRPALVVVGALGLAAAIALGQLRVLSDLPRPHQAHRLGAAGGVLADVRFLAAAPILMAFAYFILLASSLSAMQTFSVSALVAIYAVPLTLASGALTAYLLGNAGGILIGGILADNVGRHHLVAGGGMALAAAGALFIGHALATPLLLAPLMALVGFAKGVTGPSRDLLVRSATPPGASGKVFGFVYSGLDLGALAMPPVYGWLMDRGEPQAVFLVSAMLMIATILTVFEVRRQGAPAQART